MQTEILYSPSDFVAIFNQSIEYSFGLVAIEGEISSFRVSKGKWVYFDIKDQGATLKCFGTIYMLPGPLEDGMLVRIVCTPRLHPQFNFSLNIQSIIPVGAGAIAKQAELLYKKLESEGLFAPDRKRAVPYPPERLALITSSESAAYADFTKITKARWPYVQIDIYDVQVQGASSPEQIIKAFETINVGGLGYEVVVLIRGGGSAEDLAVFNDERVVRAVAGSRIPTMVAIGHETDESLAELVGDARASTPSNAAELLVPDMTKVKEEVSSITVNLFGSLRTAVSSQRELIESHHRQITNNFWASLILMRQSVVHAKERLSLLNPQEVLRRGYSVVRRGNKTVKFGNNLAVGDEIDIIFIDTTRKAIISDHHQR